MPKFRKKPIEVEAVQVKIGLDFLKHPHRDWRTLPQWLQDAIKACIVVFTPLGATMSTAEGIVTGQPDDWLIQGVQGEIYPCKAHIFEATYEAVEQAPASSPPCTAADFGGIMPQSEPPKSQ